jgi:hypothetical protein
MPAQSRQALYAARRRAGLCNRCAAKAPEGKTMCEACMAKHADERRANRASPMLPQQLTQRNCLRCDRSFMSTGAYNRLCHPCREFIDVNPTPEEVALFRKPSRPGRAP